MFYYYVLAAFYYFIKFSIASIVIENSAITNVTLFPSMAEVERSFRMTESLKPGYYSLLLNMLPGSLDDQSVRLRGTGNAEILETLIVERSTEREKVPEVVAKYVTLQEKLSVLKLQEQSLLRSANRIKSRIDIVERYVEISLQTNTQQAAGATPVKVIPTLDDAKQLISLHDDTLAIAHAELASNAAELAPVQSHIKSMEKVLSDLRNQGRHDSEFWPRLKSEKELSVHIYIPPLPKGVVARPLEFFVLYMIPAASWRPQYDIRLSNAATKGNKNKNKANIEIDYYASVDQSTGEDWNNSYLTLCTADPSLSTQQHYVPKPISKGVYHYAPPPPGKERIYNGLQKKSQRTDDRLRNKPTSAIQASSYSAAGMDMDEMMVMEEPVAMSAPKTLSNSMGDLAAAHLFSILHPVSINSTLNYDQVHPNSHPSSHRILIDSLQLQDIHVLSYCAPSISNKAYMRTWGQYSTSVSAIKRPKTKDMFNEGEQHNTDDFVYKESDSASASLTALSPLLESDYARVFLEGSFSGIIEIPNVVYPENELRLSLGQEKNVEVTSTYILPKNGRKEEKASWFLAGDTKKYRVKVEEYLFSVKNMHQNTPVLAVVTDNLPVSTQEDIKIEIISPRKESLDSSTDDQNTNDDDCLYSFLNANAARLDNSRISVMKREDGVQTAGDDQPLQVLCKATSNIFWIKWLRPKEKLDISYKYKLIWPDDKNTPTVQ